MENKEILCRLFYRDTMFGVYTNSKDFIKEDIEKELTKIKKESEDLLIDDIRKRILKINPNNEFWYKRFENKNSTKKIIKCEKLVIEQAHNNLDNLFNSDGKKIVDFLRENKNNKEVLRRLNFILENFEIINKFLPIIVKQTNNNFEIMSGNHRAMAYMEKGFEKIEVLVIK